MINKWIIDNFKSINREQELHFRPLTIFTGANSSGKSTILQSILLVTQTLQDQIESRSIVLNGWFKKFGTYSDIVFHREDERNIKIGFEIEEDEHEYNIDHLRVMRIRRDSEKTFCRFVLSSDGGKKDLLLPVLKVVQKAPCYLLKENLARYRRRANSITPKPLWQRIWAHYPLFRIAEEMNPVAATFWTLMNVFGNGVKKIFYVKKS